MKEGSRPNKVSSEKPNKSFMHVCSGSSPFRLLFFLVFKILRKVKFSDLATN